MDGVGPVEVGGAEGNGRRVADADVQVGWRGEDAVLRGRVGDGVSGRRSTQDRVDMQSRVYLMTSPTLTFPVWCRSNMLLARISSRRCSVRDWDSRKYEERASTHPASGIWERE